MRKTVVILSTLDTKSDEVRFLRERIEEGGISTVVVDAGVLGQPCWGADISSEEVAHLGGSALRELRTAKDEGAAIQIMSTGATKAVQNLYTQGRLHGIVGLGGSLNTSLGTHVMRSLPFGVPKLMVSTMASRDISPWIGHKDIVVFPSVTDISGLNFMTKRTLANAAGAIVGMVKADLSPAAAYKPVIGVGMLGATEGCVKGARPLLESMGYEVIVFHTVGSGGRALEDLIQQGLPKAVLETSVQELLGHIFQSPYDSGPDRFENAGKAGIPQVILPGNADFIAWNPPHALPPQFDSRHKHMHNPNIALVRTNAADMQLLAERLARKLNKSASPAAVVISKGGFSEYSREGMFFHEPAVDRVFGEALHERIKPEIEIIEVASNINDPPCAQAVVEALQRLGV
ncbi:MAG: UPF0261 family protein [Anaerolineae bacterium]|nr:UPF0261 family protein [Anaerolineae bacterium]NIN97081.1 UPF0261 family protein [Anaerolineae bacterium]NIQ80029.1 UPF0261 family protein [Anaerolineae bacterium]